MTTKDMLTQHKAAVQDVKVEHQSEGEGGLARKKWKAIVLSIED